MPRRRDSGARGLLPRLRRALKLDFPYKRLDMEPPEDLFARLRERRLVVTRPGGQEPWTYGPSDLRFHIAEDAYYLCDALADYFTEPARVRARVRGRYSPYEMWRWYRDERPEELLSLARRRSTGQESATHLLREVVYDVSWECTQFKVSLARHVWQHLLEGVPKPVVLDPCAGWGDRLIGALSLPVERYVGLDPNGAVHPGLHEAAERFGGLGGRAELHHLPLERLDEVLDQDFDAIFTSPPFFDYEIYTEERGQSVLGFDTVEQWREQWLLPAVLRLWARLRPGGALALYLADTSAGSYCAWLVDALRARGLELTELVACLRGEDGHPLPLWIWRKRRAP
jgi:hypothetical protein